MPTTFSETRSRSAGRCDAEVKGDGQRVGLLSQSARHVVDDVNPDLKFGMPQPSVGKFGRPVQRKPAANSSVISVRGVCGEHLDATGRP